MAPPTTEFDRQLRELEGEIKKLEVEYNLFFAGRIAKLPWDTRARVEALVKRYDRQHIQNTAERFRFQGLQSRFSAFCELWERNLKSREGGRPAPRGRTSYIDPGPARSAPDRAAGENPLPPGPAPDESRPAIMSVRDPAVEADKVRALHAQLNQARRQAGEGEVPFERFQEVVRAQVSKLGQGGAEVAFKVSVKDGRVAFTAKLATAPQDES
ncbi:MAG: MXAN_5187 C-terminal domain-containing protein [Acidobacteriota bacterium]